MSGLSPDALCRNVNTPRSQSLLTTFKKIRHYWISTSYSFHRTNHWIFVLTQSKNCHQRHGLH